MNDDNLKQILLDTGDKSLVYISNDEWGGLIWICLNGTKR